MAEKKITKRESFTEIKEFLAQNGKDRLAKVMEHELELLAKKNASGSGKMTASQKANEEIKNAIIEEMAKEPNRLYSVSEMIKNFDCCAEFTLPKVTALVTQLVKEEKIARVEEKRKALFKAV